jgi:hypothetical protein
VNNAVEKPGNIKEAGDEIRGPDKWPTARSPFGGNPWHLDAAEFVRRVQERPMLWLEDNQLKYLDIRVDTRSGHFIVSDRDGNRIHADRVIDAICRSRPTA